MVTCTRLNAYIFWVTYHCIKNGGMKAYDFCYDAVAHFKAVASLSGF